MTSISYNKKLKKWEKSISEFLFETYFYGSLIWPVAKPVRRATFHRCIGFDIFSNGRIRLYRKQAGGIIIAQAIRRIICFPILLLFN